MARHRAGERVDQCEDCSGRGRVGRQLLLAIETGIRRLRCIDSGRCARRRPYPGPGPEPMGVTLAARLAGELP